MVASQIPAEEVNQALECLYDAAALAEVPLARRFAQVAGNTDPFARAQRLRTVLMDGIELLQPSRPAAFRSADARSYEVLALRFIESLSMVQVADELHISRRQVYRDLMHAVEGLAKLLSFYPWSESADAAREQRPEVAGAQQDPLADELRRVGDRPVALELRRVLELAVQTVRPMATQWRIEVIQECGEEPITVFASEPLLRQTLINALSTAIRGCVGDSVRVAIVSEAEGATVTIELAARERLADPSAFAECRGLAEAQRLTWEEEGLPAGCLRLRLRLPARRRRLVLVVEDNPGVVDLYRRYLAESGDWQLLEVRDPRLCFEMARKLQPAVIILDVLMPEQDGWTVMQVLRAQPETARIPLLVCSVFDELDLAASLGATAYVKKPVSQFQLLAALQRCLEG